MIFNTIPETPDDGKNLRRRKEGRKDDVSLLQLVAIVTEEWLTFMDNERQDVVKKGNHSAKVYSDYTHTVVTTNVDPLRRIKLTLRM